MAGGGGEETLEYTPTWVVAVVCSVIIAISLTAESLLHYTLKYLTKKNQKPLFDKNHNHPQEASALKIKEPLHKALLKIKEELMLLGFISLLLTVGQDRINKICIPKHLSKIWLPCKLLDDEGKTPSSSTTAHFTMGSSLFSSHLPVPTVRHLLTEASSSSTTGGYCEQKGKAPLLSITALHHLHIFIFVLAVVHVIFCVLTILFGSIKIRQWKTWEDSKKINPEEVLKTKFRDIKEHDFIRGRFVGIGKGSTLMGWLQAFFKQFHGSVTKSEYTTLRHGFIETHFRGHPKFDFYNYMVRALEADFKRVVGISWYLWLFVVVFMLLNVYGWHAYFWIAFVPLILLLAVGTKLEHVITQLAQEVAVKPAAVEGDLVVKPSDHHFWFHRPRLVLLLIHMILFQNSFEMAFFFWIWVQYKFESCIMGEIGYIIPRIVIGVFVQFFCSYRTLPLYALVTQMGSSYKGAVFEEHVQEGLIHWAHKAKRNNGWRRAIIGIGKVSRNSNDTAGHPQTTVEMVEAREEFALAMEEGHAGEIQPAVTTSIGGEV